MSEPNPPTPSTDTTKALDKLTSLPSLEDTTTRLQAAIDQITTAATTLIPSITWESATNEDKGNCQAPYEQTDGKRYFLPNRLAQDVTVSEQDWAKLLQVAKDASATLGATDMQVMQDQPGKRDVGFYGPAGLFLKFSYKGNMVVSGYTGCRLPQSEK